MEKEKVEEFVKVVQDIKIDVGNIKQQVNRIEIAVSGDEAIGFKGIVPQLYDHEERLVRLEKYKMQLVVSATVISIIFTGIWTLILKFL